MKKGVNWTDQIHAALAVAETRDIPKDETVEYAFREMLREFCEDNHRGERLEDLWLGKPWLDEEVGRHYYRFRDLQRYLEREQFKVTTRRGVATLIQTLGQEGVDYGTTTKKCQGSPVEVKWVRAGLFKSTPDVPLPEGREDPI